MESPNPLKEYRSEHGLTQADLAEMLGVKPPAICKWEKGRVAVDKVLQIEQRLGIERWRLRPDIYPPPEEVCAEEAA
mgnify:CR=1 FL=1